MAMTIKKYPIPIRNSITTLEFYTFEQKFKQQYFLDSAFTYFWNITQKYKNSIVFTLLLDLEHYFWMLWSTGKPKKHKNAMNM